MNKKQLIIAALATVMSVSAACAESFITGIANGDSGTFNIDPAKANSDVGYRQYQDFTLGQGDIANLNYQYNGKDLGTFINLVDHQINIQGILNALGKNGNGHAVFISPEGMIVGQNGVLNVGTLSVITPTSSKYKNLTDDYEVNNFDNINQINHMRNNTSAANPNNYGGNAPVNVQGYVFARNGVDIRGSQVDVTGGIVNAYNQTQNFESFDAAQALFNSLVNTDGINASGSQILNNGSSIVIKSGAGADNYINVANGKIANLTNGETVLTNHGNAGLTLDGAVVAGNGKVNIYNNNSTGALTVKNGTKAFAHQGDLSVTSKGGMDVKSGTTLNAAQNLEVVNKGHAMVLNGTLLAGDRVDIVNSGDDGATVNGTIGTTTNKPNTIRIVNENGKLSFAATAKAARSVSIRNNGAGGADVNGSINAAEGVLIRNTKGNLALNGVIGVTEGVVVDEDTENVAIAIYNEGNGKLTTGEESEITVGKGKIAIKNAGANGMKLQGAIANSNGETAINNTKGSMEVAGAITNNGNMGIFNKGEGAMTLNADIKNNGNMNIANVNGESFTVNNKVANENGNVRLYNYNGDFEINGTVENKGTVGTSGKNGYLYVYSRETSNGLRTGADSKISNSNGDLAIKHNGTGSDNPTNKGLDLNGTIEKTGTNGELAINNHKGDMYVGGTISTNAKTGIVNRTGGGDMTVEAKITSTGNNELRIKNETGTGDMTVAGEIEHDGRLNILNNAGTLTLDGKITNKGSQDTYAIVRDPNGGNTTREGGIVVTDNFNATSTNGMILIKNKVGEDGLTYQGNVNAGNAQAELYNMTGNMNVNAGSFQGNPTIILNKGDKLTVKDAATLAGDTIKIVNKGTDKEIAEKYQQYYKEQLK